MSLTLLPVLSLTLFQASAPTLALWPSSVFTFLAVTSHTCTHRGSCLNDDDNCRQISSYLMTDLNKSPVLCVVPPLGQDNRGQHVVLVGKITERESYL